MPKFLSGPRIAAAISALTDTRAQGRLLEFLLVKRTLVIKGSSPVAIAESEPAFFQAARELSSVHNSASISHEAEKAFFNVFTVRSNKGPFRLGKWISNGPNSTISGTVWGNVIALTTDSPRKAGLVAGHEQHVADLLLKEAQRRTPKPRLGEFAVWAYRHLDVEPHFATETDPANRGNLLIAKLTTDLGLNAAEIAALFDTSPIAIEDNDLVLVVADPAAYLPGLVQLTTTMPAAADAQCSLDLVLALAAKPFVIITGTSGTGKSRSTLRLAEQLQAQYAGTVDGQIFQLVAIGPDWTSPKKLLGYRTPFGSARVRADGSATNESYEITETLRIILRACNPKSTKVPHFLVFDEMNLSHVERYFAPFLSLMEASSILEDGENAPIVDVQSLVVVSEILDVENKDSPEAESARLLVNNKQPLTLPPNLFYAGTVNVDETTYMFSPKVLDRAHVLEVRALRPSEYVAGGSSEPTIALDHANTLLREAIDDRDAAEAGGSNPAAVLDLLASKHGVDVTELEAAKALTLKVLDGCFHLLAPTGFEFAFRVVKEVHGYMYVWIRAQIVMGAAPSVAMRTWVDGLDRAIFQKVLPKIHGNRSALGDSLKALAAFLDGGDATSNPPAKYSLGVDASFEIAAGGGIALPAGSNFKASRAKLQAMHDRLVSRNYVSFVR